MERKKLRHKGFALITVVLIVSLITAACSGDNREESGEDGLGEIERDQEISVPPIDLNAPDETETATFAMG